MFHVFAFTYYILLRCVTREYSMTSVLLRHDIAIPFAIYRFHMAHNARMHYEKLLDLRDARVHYHIVVYFANIRMTRNYLIVDRVNNKNDD